MRLHIDIALHQVSLDKNTGEVRNGIVAGGRFGPAAEELCRRMCMTTSDL